MLNGYTFEVFSLPIEHFKKKTWSWFKIQRTFTKWVKENLWIFYDKIRCNI